MYIVNPFFLLFYPRDTNCRGIPQDNCLQSSMICPKENDIYKLLPNFND